MTKDLWRGEKQVLRTAHEALRQGRRLTQSVT